MANRASKGFAFERWLCETLSLWWTRDQDPSRDDVFWRTSTSGGRATRRGRKGRTTAGSYGDICAIDPIGQPLLDLVTIEAKKGYNRFTIQDLLDRSAKSAAQTYEEWIKKAIVSHEQADSFSWLLIVKRDQRIPLVFFPCSLLREFHRYGTCDGMCFPFVTMNVQIYRQAVEIAGITLEEFLDSVTPTAVSRMVLSFSKRTQKG